MMPILHRWGICSLRMKGKGSFLQHRKVITFIMKLLSPPSWDTLEDNITSVFSRAGQTSRENKDF